MATRLTKVMRSKIFVSAPRSQVQGRTGGDGQGANGFRDRCLQRSSRSTHHPTERIDHAKRSNRSSRPDFRSSRATGRDLQSRDPGPCRLGVQAYRSGHRAAYRVRGHSGRERGVHERHSRSDLRAYDMSTDIITELADLIKNKITKLPSVTCYPSSDAPSS